MKSVGPSSSVLPSSAVNHNLEQGKVEEAEPLVAVLHLACRLASSFSSSSLLLLQFQGALPGGSVWWWPPLHPLLQQTFCCFWGSVEGQAVATAVPATTAAFGHCSQVLAQWVDPEIQLGEEAIGEERKGGVCRTLKSWTKPESLCEA